MKGLKALRLGSLSLRWQPRTALVCAVLLVAMLLLWALLLGTGSLSLGPGTGASQPAGPGPGPHRPAGAATRAPAPALTATLVGAALGMAGAIFQSISRNALGSPDVIGFTTGAASGAIVQIMLFDAGPLATSLAAVAAGLGTALLVLLLARNGHSSGGYRLVLVGIAWAPACPA